MTGLPGNDTGVRRVVNKVTWAGQLEQEDSWDRTVREEQTGQDVWDRRTGRRQQRPVGPDKST
jgi:hypothetical protein